jgi:hypothetical protein
VTEQPPCQKRCCVRRGRAIRAPAPACARAASTASLGMGQWGVLRSGTVRAASRIPCRQDLALALAACPALPRPACCHCRRLLPLVPPAATGAANCARSCFHHQRAALRRWLNCSTASSRSQRSSCETPTALRSCTVKGPCHSSHVTRRLPGHTASSSWACLVLAQREGPDNIQFGWARLSPSGWPPCVTCDRAAPSVSHAAKLSERRLGLMSVLLPLPCVGTGHWGLAPRPCVLLAAYPAARTLRSPLPPVLPSPPAAAVVAACCRQPRQFGLPPPTGCITTLAPLAGAVLATHWKLQVVAVLPCVGDRHCGRRCST